MDQILQSRTLIMTSEKDSVQEIRKLAQLLDSHFQLPFGWRVGWDGIIGLVPGIGDFVTNMMSFYIVYRAAILGCSLSVILRMGLNILVDNILDTIPVLGNFLDFAWKSNMMNLALVEKYMENPHKTTIASRIIVLSAVGLMLLMVLAIAVLTFYLARWLWGTFQNAW